MRWLTRFVFLILTMSACNNQPSAPDVSNIRVELDVQRFEKDFFALDTNHLNTELDKLVARYPSFGENFMGTILGADPAWGADTTAMYVKGFIQAFRTVYDSSEKVFANFSPYLKEVEKSCRYVSYYFPEYKMPKKLITYIGPLDGFGDIITEDAFIVGLHHHLGENYSLYQSDVVALTYPSYLTRRFEPGTISVNCMSNVLSDMYPEKNDEKTLVEKMIEKGKRLYVLSKLLPEKEAYKLIGYTKKQLKESLEREAQIWNLFVQNNLLRTTEYNIIKNYVGESPKTAELGDASPGNIGSLMGWQIVKKYMYKNPTTTLKSLMETDEESIFQSSKYKP